VPDTGSLHLKLGRKARLNVEVGRPPYKKKKVKTPISDWTFDGRGTREKEASSQTGENLELVLKGGGRAFRKGGKGLRKAAPLVS